MASGGWYPGWDSLFIQILILLKKPLYYGSFEIKVGYSITSLYYWSFDMWFSNGKKSLLTLKTTTKSNKTFTKINSFRKYLQFVGLKGRSLVNGNNFYSTIQFFWKLWQFQWNLDDMLSANFHHHHMVVSILTIFFKPLTLWQFQWKQNGFL